MPAVVKTPLLRALVIDDQAPVRAMISLVLTPERIRGGRGRDRRRRPERIDGIAFRCCDRRHLHAGIDGTKIIQLLRLRDEKLPIVAISGVLLTASGRTALDFFPLAPALADVICLQKPFRDTELLQSIEKAMAEAA